MSSAPPSPVSSAEPRPEMDDRPPLLGSWRNIYGVVLGTLAVLVVLFWWLTRAYA